MSHPLTILGEMNRHITRVLERQHGVVTDEQALAAGLTYEAIRHLLRTGRWERVASGLYRLVGSPPTWEQRVIIEVLAAGPAAAASHRSAAALLGIPGFDRRGRPELTTPRLRRHRAASAIVHRWRPFPSHHLTVIDGIVTTRVARTLVDLAGVVKPGRIERAVDNCLAAGTVTYRVLNATFLELAGRGRSGVAVMRAILAERCELYIPPESELEAEFYALLRDHGIELPVRQYNVGDDREWIGRADYAFGGRRRLIELDSRRHHSSLLDRRADRERDARLRAAGWPPVERFTTDDVRRHPSETLARVRALLDEDAA
jgi:predicted transcriptional regulator of viral defense system